MVRDSTSPQSLDEYLSEISQWTCKWQMLFNPDVSKQAHEIAFSRKKNPNDSSIHFNNLLLKRKYTLNI